MSEELSREEAHRAADCLVEEVLEAAGVIGPPVDAIALARHLGLTVDPELPGPRRGASARGALSAVPLTAEQRQYFAAQALADHFRGDLLARLGIDPAGPRPFLGQSLTRLFADRLLVPTAWLADEARACGHDLLALRECFRHVGDELLASRLLDLPTPCAMTIVDNGRVVWRRSNAYRVGKKLAPAEQACLDQVQRYSRACRVSEDGWDVRGWPVHRADWKRELLRSVVEE